ncbi:major facilitator superfamily domain-containing protein [Chiua virens]|nr:major facilitator superfamily domain-containing protein [Chiua virens]
MSSVPSYLLSGAHDPHQWSKLRRWMIAFVIWHSIAPVDLALTFYSGIQQQIQNEFRSTESIVTLGVGLYNFGAIFGPLLAGPLSELYGRRPIYVISMVGFTVSSLCTALSPTIFALLASRGLAGLIGSGVFSLYGGSLSDMFNPLERAPLVALFTIMLQGAPTFGPVPASILDAFVPWRWLMGFITVWAAVIAALLAILPETEPTAIQRKLAKDQGLKVGPTRDISEMWKEAILTPITMLRHEPIVTWTTLIMHLSTGSCFSFLRFYGMSRQEAGMAFLAPWTGNLLGVIIYFVFLKPQLRARRNQVFSESCGKREILPEERLPGVVLASIFTPIGMFWFALAARPDSPRLLAILSGIPVGMGMTLMQLSLLNYYIDLYPTRSASGRGGQLRRAERRCGSVPERGGTVLQHAGYLEREHGVGMRELHWISHRPNPAGIWETVTRAGVDGRRKMGSTTGRVRGTLAPLLHYWDHMGCNRGGDQGHVRACYDL